MAPASFSAGEMTIMAIRHWHLFGFGSLITVLLLSSGPAYAEWLWFHEDKPGMTIYVNPDTITRKGDRVKMWELFDFETAEHVADTTHLSFKMQEEYDCTGERTRRLAGTFFSGNMGRGKVVYRDATKDKWEPVPPGSVAHDLWEFACSKERLQAQLYPVESEAG